MMKDDINLKRLFNDYDKNAVKSRSLNVRFTSSEFQELQSFCSQRYINYAEAVRNAVNQMIQNTKLNHDN